MDRPSFSENERSPSARPAYVFLARFVYRHYVGVILAAVALSILAGSFAFRLRFETDFAHLLPESDVGVRELNRIKERVGGIGPLSIIITGDDLERVIDFMLVLADSLERDSQIGAIVRGKSADFFSRNRLLYMERSDLEVIYTRLADYVQQEKLKRSPLYFALDDEEENHLDLADIEDKYSGYTGRDLERNYYLTEEGNGVVLRVYPTGVITDVEFYQRLLTGIDRRIAAIDPSRFDTSIRHTYQGSFKNTLYQYGVIIGDLQATALYSIVGVLLLITLYFRQIIGALFVILPLLMSLAWTFGLTERVIGSLNQITVGLFAILFGLGIDFGIHIFARYREARRRGVDIEASLVETITSTGSALTTTALTTSLAFYSLLVMDFKGFSEFGFIVGTGILFALIAMLVACPAFIVLAERFHLMGSEAKTVPPHLLRRGPYPLPRITLVLGVLATAYSLYHLKDLEFEYDFGELRPTMPTRENAPTPPKSLRDMESPAIVLTTSREEARQVVDAVQRLKLSKGDSSTVRAVKSVYSLLPGKQEKKLETIGHIRQLIDESTALFNDAQRSKVDSLRSFLNVRELTLEDLPTDLTRSFTSRDGEILNFVAIYASVPLRDGRNAMAFDREVGTIRTPAGDIYHASSAHIIFARMLRLMLHDGAIAAGLTLLVVFVVLSVDLRSLSHALLVLGPLITALIWVAGIMYLFDIRLNLYNIVTFPIIIGMGVDNGVHIFHRYREAGRNSLRLVLRTTGAALTATSLTTVVGFAGLMLAHHPALRSIGTLSLVGLACSFITAVVVLPAILQLRENRQSLPSQKISEKFKKALS